MRPTCPSRSVGLGRRAPVRPPIIGLLRSRCRLTALRRTRLKSLTGINGGAEKSLRPQRPSAPPFRGFFRRLVPRRLQNSLRFSAFGRFDLRSFFRSASPALRHSSSPAGRHDRRLRACQPRSAAAFAFGSLRSIGCLHPPCPVRSCRSVPFGRPTRLRSAAFRPPCPPLVPRCGRSGRSLASLHRIDLPRALRSIRFRDRAPVGSSAFRSIPLRLRPTRLPLCRRPGALPLCSREPDRLRRSRQIDLRRTRSVGQPALRSGHPLNPVPPRRVQSLRGLGRSSLCRPVPSLARLHRIELRPALRDGLTSLASVRPPRRFGTAPLRLPDTSAGFVPGSLVPLQPLRQLRPSAQRQFRSLAQPGSAPLPSGAPCPCSFLTAATSAILL